jgi:hypothetical protein
MIQSKRKKRKRTKIAESADGESCLVRIPGVCRDRRDTTCLGHLPGAGMALKKYDFLAAYVCQDCHDVLDGRQSTQFTKEELSLMHYEGVFRTMEVVYNKGLLIIKGEK